MPEDAYTLIREQYGVDVETLLNADIAQLTNADQILMRQDPRVIAWTFINLGAANVVLRPMGTASATTGIVVPPSGLLTLNWRDDGILPTLEWHAVSPAGNQAFTLIRLRVKE